MSNGVTIEWCPRFEPLKPVAVAASGASAQELARRIIARDAEEIAKFAGVAFESTLLLLGAEEDLPWVDGVTYLGVDPSAPSLLVPTNQMPSIPAALLERAVMRAYQSEAPIAVLPKTSMLIAVSAARRIDAERLAAWLST